MMNFAVRRILYRRLKRLLFRLPEPVRAARRGRGARRAGDFILNIYAKNDGISTEDAGISTENDGISTKNDRISTKNDGIYD